MLIFLFLFLLCNTAFAGQVNVVTGFGYITDSNSHIIAKARYPLGSINISNGLTYTEVANHQELDNITIYTPPLSPVDAFSVDKFIADLLGSFGSDINVLPYYAAFKDLAAYKNFTAMKAMVTGLLVGGKLTQDEVNTLNSVLANQNIILSNF